MRALGRTFTQFSLSLLIASAALAG